MTLESAPFLMENVIANVVNLCRPSAAEEKIALHTAMDTEIPVLRGDAYRLIQVVCPGRYFHSPSLRGNWFGAHNQSEAS